MCNLDDYNGETCDVWHEKWVTARKTHTCAACGTGIQPSMRYLKHFDVYDGHVHSVKVCADCGEAHILFRKSHGMSPYPPDCVEQTLRECVDTGDADSFWVGSLDLLRHRKLTARESK